MRAFAGIKEELYAGLGSSLKYRYVLLGSRSCKLWMEGNDQLHVLVALPPCKKPPITCR